VVGKTRYRDRFALAGRKMMRRKLAKARARSVIWSQSKSRTRASAIEP
jgi:hypothetical protein